MKINYAFFVDKALIMNQENYNTGREKIDFARMSAASVHTISVFQRIFSWNLPTGTNLF
jgi:hypothetical protein